jgi:hypothetical protein
MIPVQVMLQYVRAGAKESRRVKLAMDGTVEAAIQTLVAELELPNDDYQLLKGRSTLSQKTTLFDAGVQENDILQLVAMDRNATQLGSMSGGILNRLGGKISDEPLPVFAMLADRSGEIRFQLKRIRALVGRADANMGYPAEMFDVELSDLDPQRTVSRPHALVVYQNGEFTVRDLYSQHGLLLNGEQLPPNKAYPLRQGDALTLGEVELFFYCE